MQKRGIGLSAALTTMAASAALVGLPYLLWNMSEKQQVRFIIIILAVSFMVVVTVVGSLIWRRWGVELERERMRYGGKPQPPVIVTGGRVGRMAPWFDLMGPIFPPTEMAVPRRFQLIGEEGEHGYGD